MELGTLDSIIDSNKEILTKFDLTNSDEVNYILKHKIKIDKASGIDKIPPKCLKILNESLTTTLVKLINDILTTGIFPDLAKEAVICPIFKGGDKSNPNNYRPISLLSVLSKLVEYIIKNRLVSHFNKNDFFFKFQYGFMEKSDTQSATIDLVTDLYNDIDKGLISAGVFLDMTKAFDLVPHDLLIFKLKSYGLDGLALDLIHSYLSNRKQRVQIGDTLSDYKIIKSGVPQGSILGPILFVVFINDISNLKLNGSLNLYADDTAIFNKDRNQELLVSKTNEDIVSVTNYFMVNRLIVNESKTKLMLFHSPQKRFTSTTSFIFNSSILVPSASVKYLGLYFDSFLKWENHIASVTKSIAPVVGLLFRLKKIIPVSALLKVYYSLINSRLSYLNTIWCNGYKTSFNYLNVLQHKAIKNIFNLPFRYKSADLYKNYPIRSLDFMFKFNTLIFIQKHQLNIVHSNIKFEKSYSTILTRQSNKLALGNVRTNYGRFSVTFNGAKTYNKLPEELTILSNFILFKKHLKSWLIKNLDAL